MQPIFTQYFTKNDAARATLAAEVSRWLGTPFMHRHALPGVGVDCVQLAGSIMVACGVVSAYDFGEYSLDWSLHNEHSIIEAWLDANDGFVRLPFPTPPVQGDIVCFAIGKAVHHCGVALNGTQFLHVISRGRVRISQLDDPTWGDRLASVYSAIDLRETAILPRKGVR